MTNPRVYCSFCGKHNDEVTHMVMGPAVSISICNECVDLCRDIIDMRMAHDGPTIDALPKQERLDLLADHRRQMVAERPPIDRGQ